MMKKSNGVFLYSYRRDVNFPDENFGGGRSKYLKGGEKKKCGEWTDEGNAFFESSDNIMS